MYEAVEIRINTTEALFPINSDKFSFFTKAIDAKEDKLPCFL